MIGLESEMIMSETPKVVLLLGTKLVSSYIRYEKLFFDRHLAAHSGAFAAGGLPPVI